MNAPGGPPPVNGPAVGPNDPQCVVPLAANPAGQPVLEYNGNRLELLVFFQNLGRWLRTTDNGFRQQFEMELRTLFREFARAYPAAGIGEIDAVQLVLRLQQIGGGGGTEAEYAQRIAPHQALVQILRRLKDYTVGGGH
jgi:hypothetical protein